jgi:hypothetical protein
LAYPKIWLFWINDLKTSRLIKARGITVWFRFRICKQSICICFNPENDKDCIRSSAKRNSGYNQVGRCRVLALWGFNGTASSC